MIDLVETGAITGARKLRRRNKHVATFCLGTQRLYDWLDDNDGVEMLGVEWVNNPMIIGEQPDFVSINATTEIDLIGQCASETIAGRYWSSSGGQSDFARGAMYSEGGQAFVVLHSQTRKGRTRIRSQLTPGIGRHDAEEHGRPRRHRARPRRAARQVARRARAAADLDRPSRPP